MSVTNFFLPSFLTSFFQRLPSTMSTFRSFKSSPSITPLAAPDGPDYSDLSEGPMFRFQASLPRLPVPSLTSTISKYLKSVQPHLSADAFAKTQTVAGQFLQSPQAAELQNRLNTRAADPEMKNWLADWWNNYAYMSCRDPVVVFVRSVAFVQVDI